MMDWKAYVRERLRLPQLTAEREAEIIDDLAQQLDDAYKLALNRGAAPQAAQQAALSEIPDWEHFAERVQAAETRHTRLRLDRAIDRMESQPRPQKGWGIMFTDLGKDLLYSLRTLRKNPGFAAAALLILALGIGANSAVFSILNAVMLRPLPFSESERLVRVWESNPGRNWPTFAVSEPNFLDWRDQNRSFERLAASSGRNLNLTGAGDPERVPGLGVSVDFFPVLGVNPALGRSFLPEEDTPGGNSRVVLMTHGLWQRRFGSDPAIVNKTILLNDLQYTVIGVLPKGFRWGAADLFVPLVPNRNSSRADHRLSVGGRLRPGVSVDQALTEMTGIAKQLEQRYPDSNAGWTVRIVTFYDWLVPEETRSALLILLGAVALVLLIACANVANLLLARATARRKEIAIRTALGAGGLRLARQLLTESVLLAGIGGGLGLLFAFWGLDLLGITSSDTLPRADEITLDMRVVLFTLGVSVFTGLLFGLAPALQAARAGVSEALKESGRSSGTAARNRTRNVLVVTEVALSLVLLIGMGLLLRSFRELLRVQPGFETQNLLTANISLPNSKYPTRKEFVAFHQRLLEELRALPGAKAASISSGIPFDGSGTAMEVQAEGRQAGPDGQQPSAQWRLVAPGYFAAMGMPLLQGRDLNDQDFGSGTVGVVISQQMAQQVWPGEDPVGRRFHPWAERDQLWTVVGVVGNVRNFGLDTEAGPVVYINFAASVWNPMAVVLRTETDPAGYATALRTAVRNVDPNVPVAAIRPMEEMLDSSTAPRRFNVLLLTVFAGVALALAAVGLFGVMAYLVAQRTHEIGLRIALGAQRTEIFRLVVGRGMLLTGIGIVTGVAGALALTRVMEGMLFGSISARDPLTFVATASLLALVSLLACWIPARRATRVDPMVALRHE